MNTNTIGEDEYRCSLCGNVFEKTISDEEAVKIFKQRFGKEYIKNHDVALCDGCFNKCERIANQ